MRILFIDGENFKFKAREALKEIGKEEPKWSSFPSSICSIMPIDSHSII